MNILLFDGWWNKDIHKQKQENIPSPEITLPETNIAPENGWLEYEFPFGIAYFQWLNSMSFREGMPDCLISFQGIESRKRAQVHIFKAVSGWQSHT